MIETTMEPKFFRITIVRPGLLRAPLFKCAHWDELGPLVKQTIDKLRGRIDEGKEDCWNCLELIHAHDDKTVFFVELGLDENKRPVRPFDVGGGACCEHCSRLDARTLRERFTIALKCWVAGLRK
jgi:hypothetical protein